MAQTYRNIFFGPARPGYKSDQVGIAWKVRQDGSRIVKLHVGEAASESYGWSEALAYLGPATARHVAAALIHAADMAEAAKPGTRDQ